MKRKLNIKIDQTAIFKRDTQGMTTIQKLEYLGMNDVEKAKFVASFRSSKFQVKEESESQKNIPVKIIKDGQISVCVLNMRINFVMLL